MKYPQFYFLFILFIVGCKSDSIIERQKIKNSVISLDSSTLKVQLSYIKNARNRNYIDSIKIKSKELEKISQEKSNDYYLAESQYYQGYHHYTIYEIDSSYYYFNKARQYFIKQSDSLGIIKSMRGMALSQTMVGDYNGAKQTSLSILDYVPKMDSSRIKSEIYLVLGFTATIQKNHQEAIDYFHQSLNESIADESKLLVLNNLAHNHIMLGEHSKSHYKKAYDILDQLERNTYDLVKAKLLADVLDNKGYLLLKLNRNQESLQYIDEAYDIRDANNDLFGLMYSYLSYTEYYEHLNPALSVKYADSAYEFAKDLKSSENQLLALKFKIKNLPSRQVRENALRYNYLLDSIQEFREKSITQFAKIRYGINETRNVNNQLKAELTKKDLEIKRNTNIRYVIIVFLVMLTLFLLYYFRVQYLKNQKKLADEIQKAEQKLSSKVHDELANSIYLTISYVENLKTIQDLTIKKNLVDKLDKVYKLSRDISRESQSIKTDHLYPKEIFSLISYYKTETTNIILIGFEEEPWLKVSANTKLHFYKILQELLTNMKKHSQSSLVSLKFQFHLNHIEFTYSDNGIGIQNSEIEHSNGLNNITSRLDIIKGKGEILASERGFKYLLSFPIESSKRL